MTLLSTSYTSLEDAWGSNFDHDHKKKKTKKISKKSTDPLCELYSKRYKKIKKPFYSKDSDMKENDYFNQIHSFQGERDDNLYYGYKDDDFTQMVNKERQQTNSLYIDEEGHCIDTHNTPKKASKKKTKSKKKVSFNIEPQDEDDLYLERAVSTEEEEEELRDMGLSSQSFDDVVDSRQDSFDRIYSNVYEETDDEISFEEEVTKVHEESKSEKSISQLIEEEMKKNGYLKAVQSLNNDRPIEFVDERQYLDLLIYLFSGIILIFIMEQFIQIGIKMKTPIY